MKSPVQRVSPIIQRESEVILFFFNSFLFIKKSDTTLNTLHASSQRIFVILRASVSPKKERIFLKQEILQMTTG